MRKHSKSRAQGQSVQFRAPASNSAEASISASAAVWRNAPAFGILLKRPGIALVNSGSSDMVSSEYGLSILLALLSVLICVWQVEPLGSALDGAAAFMAASMAFWVALVLVWWAYRIWTRPCMVVAHSHDTLVALRPTDSIIWQPPSDLALDDAAPTPRRPGEHSSLWSVTYLATLGNLTLHVTRLAPSEHELGLPDSLEQMLLKEVQAPETKDPWDGRIDEPLVRLVTDFGVQPVIALYRLLFLHWMLLLHAWRMLVVRPLLRAHYGRMLAPHWANLPPQIWQTIEDSEAEHRSAWAYSSASSTDENSPPGPPMRLHPVESLTRILVHLTTVAHMPLLTALVLLLLGHPIGSQIQASPYAKTGAWTLLLAVLLLSLLGWLYGQAIKTLRPIKYLETVYEEWLWCYWLFLLVGFFVMAWYVM